MEENKEQNVSMPPQEIGPVPSVDYGSSKSKWWKIGFLVVGLLLAISIFYTGYQFSKKQTAQVVIPSPASPISSPVVETSPTPDETADWKTYTNTKYGYSLKIPANWGEWSIKDGKNWKFSLAVNPTDQVVLLGINQQIQTTPEGIIVPPQKINIFVYLNKTMADSLRETPTTNEGRKQEPAIVGNNISATKVVFIGSDNATYFIEKDGNLYMITRGENFPEFDQILFTFKFLD